MQFLPGDDIFWNLLKNMSEEWTCVSYQAGSGNPECEIRICEKEKGVETCNLCDNYPCEKLSDFLTCYQMLKGDNILLRDNGIAEWSKLQD